MSDWKKNAATRRDIRAARDPNEVPKPGRSKKDTRKWCRGKEGVEHKPVCRSYAEVKLAGRVTFGGRAMNLYEGWKILMCEDCGKELDYYSPRIIGDKVKPPPDWVK